MSFSRRQMMMLGAASLAGGCATPRLAPASRVVPPVAPGFAPRAALRPLRLSPERLVRMTVCTRPFRPAGPRIEAEKLGDKRLVHNYGHGGAGWSLSWGCADEAAKLAFAAGRPLAIAVIGAGVIGLTTALRLVERGVPVTIHASQFPAETGSAKATGVWSPSSRIALSGAAPDGFIGDWERWARASHAAHERYVGRLGDPVEYVQQYSLYDRERQARPKATHDFLHAGRRLSDLGTPRRTYGDDEHPFPVHRVRGGLRMVFNVARYSEKLTGEFLARGGRMVRRDFPDRASLTALAEPVIVNCTGYGARALVGDEGLVPVRGQINWFPAQPEARYCLYYRQVSAYSRRDGVIVQYSGDNDDFGYGIAAQIPDRDEALRAIAVLGPLFG